MYKKLKTFAIPRQRERVILKHTYGEKCTRNLPLPEQQGVSAVISHSEEATMRREVQGIYTIYVIVPGREIRKDVHRWQMQLKHKHKKLTTYWHGARITVYNKFFKGDRS